MATLTVQVLDDTAKEVTFAACSALGDQFVNNGNIHLRIKNADAADKTVTINSQKVCNQGYDHDRVLTITAGKTMETNVFDTYRFNDANGKVQITYSDVTSLSIAVVQTG